ncbi:MAG: hypothetical protein ACPG52_11720, partial [Cognaticolwellia sp.]
MSKTLENIIQHLQDTATMNQLIAEQNLTESIRQLQTWQTERLLTTHNDLWRTKRFKPAMQFFIDEL